VFARELAELWIWGKALSLILLYSVYLGISSFLFASNNELNVLQPKEMVYITIVGAISVGLFVALIIGGDSFSGERERSTLEALLLTSANRRQIVIGKFLASVSPWPVAMVIAIPYIVILSQHDSILRTALLWGAIIGSLLSLAFTGFGMLISLWSNSNRTSLFVSLTVYLLFFLPTQFPASTETATIGKIIQELDPLDGANHFLDKIIVSNGTVAGLMPFLWGPIVFVLLVFAVLFLFAAPRLRLDAGIPIKLRRKKKNVAIVSILLATSFLISLGIAPARALPSQSSQPTNLQIAIDKTSVVVKTGDNVKFHTMVTNSGMQATPPLIVAMNIINLDSTGEVVDPEDWSPERTQYLESIVPGASAKQSWTLNTVLSGNYMVYMVLIPTPGKDKATSQPVTSKGIHVRVKEFMRLNPEGILPFAIGIPVTLVLIMLAITQLRRRGIDMGGSD
jgi:ABC-2 type transport system permease protein